MSSEVLEDIVNRAKRVDGKIVIPESYDVRVIEAVKTILEEHIARVVLIGKDDLKGILTENGINVANYSNDLEIIDISLSDKYEEYSQKLYKLRQAKGMTIEEARELCKKPMYYATMMVKLHDATGVVAGATWPTADTLRPALQIIKAKEGESIVSSFFLMNIENSSYENNYVFADCGTVPNPTCEELAHIAIQSAKTYKLLMQKEPAVAMLSYSTMGSAKSETIEKVQKAVELCHEIAPNLALDGELQLDAAIDKEVAKSKAPKSTVAGNANVLIFPNLEAGNIGYKLVERFAKAHAIGPITQGMAAPINDLSRGCKAFDIVIAVAITKLQAYEV